MAEIVTEVRMGVTGRALEKMSSLSLAVHCHEYMRQEAIRRGFLGELVKVEQEPTTYDVLAYELRGLLR